MLSWTSSGRPPRTGVNLTGGETGDVRGNLATAEEPQVTFFLCSNGEGGRARRLSTDIGRPAGVLPGVLREGVDDDEGGGVGHLVKVKHHILSGPNRLPVVEPAYLWLRRAGQTCVEAGHLAVWHRATCDWLDENWLLTNGGFL